MKIVLVTETFPPEINGVAMTLGRLTDELRLRSHEVTIVRPRQKSDGTKEDPTLVPGLPIPGYAGLRFGLPCVFRLKQIIKQVKPDYVHVATEGPLGWAAARACKGAGVKLVTSFHTNFHAYGKHYGYGILAPLVFAYLRRFHNRARVTFVPTATIRDELLRAGFQRAEVMGRGVDTELFHPNKRSEELRREWLADGEGPVVVYVGRVAAEKNLVLAVKTFRRMQALQSSCRMVIVGDGPLRGKLEKQNPDFIFCGAQRGDELARHYASADVFLFASTTETYGNVIMEAMACGLVVVAYDYAAAAVHIRNGQSGLTVPIGEDTEFIRLGSSALSHAAPDDPMRLEARRCALAVSWQKVVSDYEDHLKRL